MKAFYMHFTINLINNCRQNFRTFFHETAFLAKNARFSCPCAADIYPPAIYGPQNNQPKLCVCVSHKFYYVFCFPSPQTAAACTYFLFPDPRPPDLADQFVMLAVFYATASASATSTANLFSSCAGTSLSATDGARHQFSRQDAQHTNEHAAQAIEPRFRQSALLQQLHCFQREG